MTNVILKLLREAGFTTEEALQIMTSNGAKILDREDIGAIAINRRADFVILDGKLENDPSVIRKVRTVFKAGIAYNPQSILKDMNRSLGVNLP